MTARLFAELIDNPQLIRGCWIVAVNSLPTMWRVGSEYFPEKVELGGIGVNSSGAIRDFRGAMVGRTDKGLFITTGTFTADPMHEATRDGAPPIDLIDGDSDPFVPKRGPLSHTIVG